MLTQGPSPCARGGFGEMQWLQRSSQMWCNAFLLLLAAGQEQNPHEMQTESLKSKL